MACWRAAMRAAGFLRQENAWRLAPARHPGLGRARGPHLLGGRAARSHHLLLLREDLLLELALRLPPLALGLLLPDLALELRLLRPLEAVPRPELLLREDDEPDLLEEEELRDGMACSFGRLV